MICSLFAGHPVRGNIIEPVFYTVFRAGTGDKINY